MDSNSKNTKDETASLRLGDIDSIWTKFCFLDETGSLNSVNDPLFTVGLIKMSQPYYLQSRIHYERSAQRFFDELKFNKLSNNNIGFAKGVIDAYFDTRSVDFYLYTTRKDSWYYQKHFGGNQWTAYESITLKLLDIALAPAEILILLADHITTPKNVRFEVDTKRNFNSEKARLALAGVCRFDSRANDLLQVVDLLIGCVSYDIKYAEGVVTGSRHKLELVAHLKAKLGISTFVDGTRTAHWNSFIERGEDKYEKGPSS